MRPTRNLVIAAMIRLLESFDQLAKAQDFRTSLGRFLRHRCRGVDGFELIGREVAECLMETLGIVNGFDVAEHAVSSVFPFQKFFVVGPLEFEGPEEAFHGGVVVAATGAAHRALNAERV